MSEERGRKILERGDALDERTTLIEPIGRGGMGVVWLARFSTLEAEVVVKLLAPELSANAAMRERLLREARAAARVQSTHAVKVYDARTSERFGPFLVMERLDGESLHDRLARTGAMSFANARRVVAQVAHAVDDAHRQGVIHRDIKPGNIFLVRTAYAPFVVKVLDFGIARIEDETMTEAGKVLGTPSFMSPEQLEGERVDGRSDLYSLALVFFKCVTGANAITSASVRALGIGVYRLPLPSPRDHVPDLPAAIDAWFARATAVRPDDRFASGAEMARALEQADASAVAPTADEAVREVDVTVGAANEPSGARAWMPSMPAPPSALPHQGSQPGSTWRLSPWLLAAVGVGAATGLGMFAYVQERTPQAGMADAAPRSRVPNDAEAAGAGDIRIGVLVDLGSSHRERGRAIQGAIGAAEMLFDSHGGVRGRRLRYAFIDDHGATAAGPLRELLDAARAASSLPLVVGPTTSDQVVTALPWLESTRTLAVSASATMVSDRSSFLVRTAPSDAQAAIALAALVSSPSQCRKVAVVRSADVYGASFERALTPAFAARGAAVTLIAPVSPLPEKSYAATLDAVARAGVTCEVLVLPAPVGARYLLEAAPRKRNMRSFGSDSLAGHDFIALARGARQDVDGPSAAEGTMGVRSRPLAPGRTERRFFERLLVDGGAGGVDVETFAASAFDAAMLAGLAVEKVGTEGDAAAYRAAIIALSREGATYGPQDLDELLLSIRQNRDVDYQGASGNVDMDDNGDVRADFSTWRVENGRIIDVLAP